MNFWKTGQFTIIKNQKVWDTLKSKSRKSEDKMSKLLIKKRQGKVFSFVYCEIQNLLRYQNAFGYSTSRDIWICDYYFFNTENGNIIFSIGYSPVGNRIDYKVTEKFNNKARKINQDYSLSYAESKKKVNNLLKKFIKYLDNLEC